MPQGLTGVLEEWKCLEEEYQHVQVREASYISGQSVCAVLYSNKSFR